MSYYDLWISVLNYSTSKVELFSTWSKHTHTHKFTKFLPRNKKKFMVQSVERAGHWRLSITKSGNKSHNTPSYQKNNGRIERAAFIHHLFALYICWIVRFFKRGRNLQKMYMKDMYWVIKVSHWCYLKFSVTACLWNGVNYGGWIRSGLLPTREWASKYVIQN